jgi:peroxiredoxin-like protein
MVVDGLVYNQKFNPMEPHFYKVDVNWKNTRMGQLSSPEIGLADDKTIIVTTPPEFPNGITGYWSPEHLFTAAVSSCLMTTFLAIAENSKLEFVSFSCKSSGKLEQIEGKFLMSEILLEPTVVLKDEKDSERAERVLQKSEAACLISNSITSKINMVTTIKF